MKKLIVLLCAALFISSQGYADTHGHIDAQGLKALIDSRTPFVLLDARGENWNDGNIIPGALLASYEDDAFDMLIPSGDSLVVVYCYSATCPLGRRLVEKLQGLGYENVIEYLGGLKEWRDIAGYMIDLIEVNK